MLLANGAVFEEQSGHHGIALQATGCFYFERHDRIVKMFLANGANVNAQSGLCGIALSAAFS